MRPFLLTLVFILLLFSSSCEKETHPQTSQKKESQGTGNSNTGKNSTYAYPKAKTASQNAKKSFQLQGKDPIKGKATHPQRDEDLLQP